MRSVTLTAPIGAAVALGLMCGPAVAVTPSSVVARAPAYAAATRTMSAAGSFVNAAAATATYTYAVQLIRTTGSARPSCAPGGCVTGGGTRVVVQRTGSLSVRSRAAGAVSVTASCGLGAGPTASYWTWVRISDVSGNVVSGVAGPLSGAYC